MASFYYNYQNPSGFSFLMLIRAIVLCSPLELQQYNTIFISPYTQHLQMGRKNEEKKLKKENKWRGNLKETTRLITSQASSLN